MQYRVSGPNIAEVPSTCPKDLPASCEPIRTSTTRCSTGWSRRASSRWAFCRTRRASLAFSSEDIATTLNGVFDGASITQVKDSIYLVNVVGRATSPERASIDTLRDLQLTWLERSTGASWSPYHAALRNRAADNMAAVAASHDHAQGKQS